MVAIRILHLADLHLGYRSAATAWGSAAPNPRDLLLDRIAAKLTATYSEARFRSWEGQRLDLILIAGDLFDTHRPADGLVRRVIAAIKRMQNLGAMVITLPGNHDEISHKDSIYNLYEKDWPGLLITSNRLDSPMPLMLRGQRIYLISMAYNSSDPGAKKLQTSFPPRVGEGFHLCLLHGLLREKGEKLSDQRCLHLDKEALLSSGYDYIALGHDHRPYSLVAENQLSVLANPGLISPRDAYDPAEGKLLFVDLQRGQSPVLDWQQLDLGESRPLSDPASAGEPGDTDFFDLQDLNRLAAQDTEAGRLARLCLRDLFLTKDPNAERHLHRALHRGLRMLAETGEVKR